MMATKLDKAKKKGRSSEWTKTGSFMHKPDKGWIHPDGQLQPDAGICYGVRYIGCLEVKESMRELDFDTRTALAREAIGRVCEAAGLKTAGKKKKVDKKLGKMLGDRPILQYAGSNVNLTITIDSLNLMIMESGEIIANHQMPGISFASGGDAETLDFVAYVAKDAINGRACHILECGGGLTENTVLEGDAWGEDEGDYYNDRPGARPPSPEQKSAFHLASQYASPKSNLPVSDGVYSSVKEPKPLLYDTPKEQPLIDFGSESNVYDNKEPFSSDLPEREKRESTRNFPEPDLPQTGGNIAPMFETWYHGALPRKQAENLLKEDGDFLVRQSSNDLGQFVLSGRQHGVVKHLLLVDPDGVVRTKDHTFDSVPHLIHYHRTKNLPIISQESELRLIRPISNTYTNC
ncbi:hypothetical protein KUTeg_018529 [Tegillarca granosa]|uniref:SHC-transforming protein 1 n=1 Tax=Tegillarca granosa TaxID=220873 RepID=A0ABQ9EM34_TEGGR|nr:hypothetical protein KUTeg_018529 [Tegillarca granosa]